MLGTVRHSCLFLLFTFLVACGGSDHSPDSEAGLNPPDDPEQQLEGTTISLPPVRSAITGITYPVHIYLPPNYGETEIDYPVIYATDGQWVFEGFAKIIEQLDKEVVLVAIEQGSGDRRAVDYIMPGARDYFDFLISELIPLIENEYRIDAEQRTLVGTSYGGVFVGMALLLDDISAPAFKHLFCFDGSFWEHPALTEQLEQDRYNASQELRVDLVLTSAAGNRGNDVDVTRFQSLLESRNYIGLNITRRSYNVFHNDVADPSFRDAVADFF